MSKIEKLADEIVGLTLLEAVELKDILKDKHGIEPAAGAVAVAAGPAVAEAVEEKTEFGRRPSSTSSSSPLARRRSTSSRKSAPSPAWA
jgi:ribosomal protein L7/L12